MSTIKHVAFIWVENASPRLFSAQQRLEKSILDHGLTPLRYPAGSRLTPLGDVLCFARTRAESSAMVWCNSDLQLTRNPYDVPNPELTYGFHRTEVPSGNICCGVDMYYIPTSIWDNILSNDIPKLYVGASFVDRWISRKMASLQKYDNLTGYIEHETHQKSDAASNAVNSYYRENLKNYNVWASRNGLESIQCPPHYLPGLGYVWGVRDTLKKLIRYISK